MKRIPFINDKDAFEQFPQMKQWRQRIIKAVLYHLDGTTSEMKLTFPVFTAWGEPCEIAGVYMSLFIEDLTTNWLTIKSYQIHTGSVDHKGNEVYTTTYEMNEIPLNKVYVRTGKAPGRLVSPHVAEKRKRNKKELDNYQPQFAHELIAS